MEKQYRLPKAFAEKWLAALRSGNYKQTSACLYAPNQDAFCCLGVVGNLCGIPNSGRSGKSYNVSKIKMAQLDNRKR